MADVDAVVTVVDLGQPLQAPAEEGDLGRRGPLLGGEDLGRVDEASGDVARHQHLDRPPHAAGGVDGGEGGQAAVGGGRPAHAHDHPGGAGVEGGRDQLAGAPGRRPQRVVALGPAHQVEARRPGHLQHRGAVGLHPPLGLHRVAEGTVDGRVAGRTAQGLERALAAVGHRDPVARPPRPLGGVGDGGRHLGRGGRPPELVGRGHQSAKLSGTRIGVIPTGLS